METTARADETTRRHSRTNPLLVPGWAIILVSLVGVYLFLNLALFRLFDGATGAYIVRPASWSLVAGIALLVWRYHTGVRPLFTRRLAGTGLLIGAFQVALLVIASLHFGFAANPHSFTPFGLLINSTLFLTTLAGIEFSRAFLVKRFSGRYRILGLALVAILFTLLGTSLSRLLHVGLSADSTAPFLGETIIAVFAQNLLACLLALLSGPVAAMGYMGVLAAFQIFSPIQPNLPWAVAAFIGTVAPVAGIALLQSFTKSENGQSQVDAKRRRIPRMGWVATAVIGLVMIWSFSGLLGFNPTVVAGHSMEPTIDFGDIAIVSETNPQLIKVGDVIRFRQGNSTVIHRVIEVQNEGTQLAFVTKGDNNDAADSHPLHADQVMGKVRFAIPKLGWVSIWMGRLLN